MKTESDIKLGITMGCPAGVGPEIIIKAFAERPDWLSNDPAFHILVLGDERILKKAALAVGTDIPVISLASRVTHTAGAINVYPVSDAPVDEVCWGRPTALTGELSYRYVTRAIELCMADTLSGMVTAPISKLGLRFAGIPYPGHTEMLAEKTGAKRYAMMLAGEGLRVVLVTIHCPLSDVPGSLTTEKIFETISITHASLRRDFGISKPRIAVAALNPHGGEAGLFGHAEEEIISPAIALSRAEGVDATGPFPPDTVFYLAAVKRRFDAVVCQYHDQGLIPFKLLHFKDGVNVTIGLPIVRTSVDHGTAYDIAGSGNADPSSLIASVEMARQIIRNRLALP
ncbi:MAG: 4-hydroxythreonine-4-phosphate dehydrogenase PdxA [Desulfobacteraceae bacterium]|nr:4-hydroxythreonine-4-phosphate dehydrogenase PdxA [Desulfobacteraceae bacterium]